MQNFQWEFYTMLYATGELPSRKDYYYVGYINFGQYFANNKQDYWYFDCSATVNQNKSIYNEVHLTNMIVFFSK